ncbi:MAG: c-type cytochrome [Magnetococcales bacterium]|nr:c-type cytochrome [Magnetococcales bacterium]
MMKFILTWLCLIPGLAFADAATIYLQHCASCHHPERLGGTGPALFPENLGRLKPEQAQVTIAQGRPASQMPPFQEKLTAEEIRSLVSYIYQPSDKPIQWDIDQIRSSHQVLARDLPAKPRFDADPLNLFVVVETGDHHISLLDGDKLEVIQRFPTRFALHGGPKFSPDGRFVTTASRDGWISLYDLYNFALVAEVRAGINTRNLAVSGDGKTVMVANYLPHTLVALDARDLTPLKVIPVSDEKSGKSSRVSAVYSAPPRHTFVAALKDLPEVWEIPYNDQAAPVITGMVHDYQPASGEALPVAKGPFPVRRILVEDYLDDFFFDGTYSYLVGASRDGGSARVVNLDVRRTIGKLDLPGMPHLASGILWEKDGVPILATPHLKEAMISFIDMKKWQIIKRIATEGPGFFMRSHENTPYAWVDTSMGGKKDRIHIVDKRTLEIVKTLQPAPGRQTAHVEFSRDGKYALLSVSEMDGELVIYDAATLEEVKRLPMKKPSGKYNVFNKINRSSGTSH